MPRKVANQPTFSDRLTLFQIEEQVTSTEVDVWLPSNVLELYGIAPYQQGRVTLTTFDYAVRAHQRELLKLNIGPECASIFLQHAIAVLDPDSYFGPEEDQSYRDEIQSWPILLVRDLHGQIVAWSYVRIGWRSIIPSFFVFAKFGSDLPFYVTATELRHKYKYIVPRPLTQKNRYLYPHALPTRAGIEFFVHEDVRRQGIAKGLLSLWVKLCPLVLFESEYWNNESFESFKRLSGLTLDTRSPWWPYSLKPHSYTALRTSANPIFSYMAKYLDKSSSNSFLRLRDYDVDMVVAQCTECSRIGLVRYNSHVCDPCFRSGL